MSADPLTAVYAALEHAGCDPRGPQHDFTARCPAHDDASPSLSIGVGADGRALLHCFAGCVTADILSALGLTWPDLFPPGHHHARRPNGIARPRRPLDLVLGALRELGIDYRTTRDPGLWVAEHCPACGVDGYPLWIVEDDDDRRADRVLLSCFNGCAQHAILEALAGEPS